MTDKLVEAVARAIEGPHFQVPESSKFTLEQLRGVRWGCLSSQEQGTRRIQAQAAIEALASSSAPEQDRAYVPTGAEIQSGHDRLQWAEGLIRQLPDTHDGRNSWLLNYGQSDEAKARQKKRQLVFNKLSRSVSPPAVSAPQDRGASQEDDLTRQAPEQGSAQGSRATASRQPAGRATPRASLCGESRPEGDHQAQGRGELAERLYHELIYAVARKHEGETRHETALRYIRERETAAPGAEIAKTSAAEDKREGEV